MRSLDGFFCGFALYFLRRVCIEQRGMRCRVLLLRGVPFGGEAQAVEAKSMYEGNTKGGKRRVYSTVLKEYDAWNS